MKRFMTWGGERVIHKDPQYWLSLPLEEKRKVYKCGEDYLTLKHIPTWKEYKTKKNLIAKSKPMHSTNEVLNSKVSLWQGDITCLEIDAVVNAANRSLLGGGGVDGCIHRAAGPSLLEECRALNGCRTGQARLTSGHQLPAKYVLHAVGPVGQQAKKLQSSYSKCLSLALEHDIRSLAFCCISTGIYGYPNRDAAFVALSTVRKWLEDESHSDKIDRIIFCTFLSIDVKIYEELMPRYFPDEVENEKTYSGDEADGQTINISSGDEAVASSTKKRRDGESKTDVVSSGSDTDVYEDAVSDLNDGEKLQTGKEESEKPLMPEMRTVSAPSTTCADKDIDSESATGSPKMETNGDTSSNVEPQTATTGHEDTQATSPATTGHEDTQTTSPAPTDTEQDQPEKKMDVAGEEQVTSSTEEKETVSLPPVGDKVETSVDEMSDPQASDEVQTAKEAVSSSTVDTEMNPAEEERAVVETAV